MKRKLLNAALFGAVLVAAPVSTFVSCADYDADINVLNKQIEDLQGIVDQKETVIKQQIAALEAQDKLLAEKDAALEEALKQCKIDCAGKLAEAKAECAAARAGLQASIDALKEALEKAKNDHATDVASLMAKDAELQGKIDDVKTYAEGVQTNLTNLSNQLNEFKTLVANTYATKEELKAEAKKLQDQIDTITGDITKIKDDIKTINETLTDAVTRLGNAESAISKLREDLDKAIVDLGGKIAANKAEIDALNKVLEMQEDGTSKTINDLKAADTKLAEDLENAVKAIRGGYTGSMKDLKDLIDGLATRVEGLEGRVGTLEGNVAKNTKAIVDMLVRIVDLEEDVYVLQNYVGTPAGEDAEATGLFKAIDDLKAEDVRLWLAIENVYTKDETYSKGEVDNLLIQKYNACLQAAKEYADSVAKKAKEDAISSSNGYTDSKIDALRNDLEDKITELRGELNTFKTYVANTYATKTELGEAETRITNAYKAADTVLYNELHGEIEDLRESLKDLINTVAVAVSSEVKGFVLEPASYYEGIQAIEGTSYEYSAWDVTNALVPTQGTGVTKYCPSVTAHYHINPSAAVLKTDLSLYTYAVLDRENRAGVNTALQPQITKVAQNGGMLDVTMKLGDASANKTPQGHMDPSEVTVMALQYTNPAAKAENQVVTSDYAVLYLNPLKEVALVDATDGHDIPDAHDPANGIFAESDLVAYNTTVPYDIEAMIKTQFGTEDPTSTLPEGFTYHFTEVAGDVVNFITDPVTGKVMPTLNENTGAPATTAVVGKSVIIRIDVMHGDKIAEVGFYKLTITGEAITETAADTKTDEVRALTCIDEKVVLNQPMSINSVWDLVVAKTGEDLATVKTKYSLTLNTDGEVKQFDAYEGEGGRTLYKGIGGKGTITPNADGTVQWVVKNNDPALTAAIHAKGDKLVTYIRVRSNDAISSDTYNEFYLPVVWEPKDVEIWPADQTATWTYDKWDLQWQDNASTGQNELRLYSDLTKVGTADYHYEIVGKAIKNNANFKVTLDDPAASFINHTEFEDFNHEKVAEIDRPHFRFIEHPNAAARKMVVGTETYNLTINASGTTMYANGEPIATITRGGVVDLINNPTSQKLLNAYEKNQLAYGETLCARVGYSVKSCAGAVRVKNGDFDVRFVKPVTFKTAPIVISDTDGIGGAKTIDFLGNLVCFNNNTFDVHPEYFDVFGAMITIPAPKTWKTNYDGQDFVNTLEGTGMEGNFSVGTVTTPVKPDGTGGNTYANIKYSNNTAVVSNFSVKVPVTLSYVWGATVVYEVELQIERTLNNSNRR